MTTTEKKLNKIKKKQKNFHESLMDVKKKVDKLDERADKTDITLTEMCGDLKTIKDMTEKISNYQEKEREQSLKDYHDFKIKAILWIAGICGSIILGALGISKLIK